MPEKLHNHYFRGITSYDDGHVHGYSGITSNNPDVPSHIHYMAGNTTLNDGHVHYYAIFTGPEVEFNGGHYHHYRGITRIADRHVHYLYGLTSVFRGYI